MIHNLWNLVVKFQISSVFQFGTLFDVTGGGYYMNPTEWINGRSGFSEGTGECKNPLIAI